MSGHAGDLAAPGPTAVYPAESVGLEFQPSKRPATDSGDGPFPLWYLE
jgi:hypothetical protein